MIYFIKNKGTARNFRCDEPWACISIATFDDTWPPIDETNREGLLRMFFDDVDIPKYRNSFSEEQAQHVLGFYEEMVEKGVEVMMVHCEAGISRSSGVVAALSKIFEGDDSYYFSDKSPYHPNRLVYRSILEAHFNPDANND